jgi:hypothetical protein
LADRLDEAPESTLHKLTQQYWQRIIALPDLCAGYRLDGHALLREPDAAIPDGAGGGPLTADVAPGNSTHRPD